MRDALLIEQLRADLEFARRVRDGARRRVSEVTRGLPDLDTRIKELEKSIVDSQAEHDILQNHADKAFERGAVKKGLAKARRRNEHGEAVKRARTERDALILRRKAVLNEAEALRNLLNLPRLNEGYVVARHHLLRAIVDGDTSDVARDMKTAWALTAEIPPEFIANPDSIWHYETMNDRGEVAEVHFFYGGTTAPTYEGESPDGDGHGHHVLVLRDGKLTLDFSRLPQYL